MSKITLYPLNGIDYDAADVAAYNAPRTSGVYASDADFVVTAAGGMSVTVSAGIGWVHPERFAGYSVVKRDPDTVTLPLADAALPRIDRLVLRYDAATKAGSLLVLKGTAASSPKAPAITRTATTYDLCLAEITRPAGSTTITTANIKDTRTDESLCGVMSDGVKSLPTAQLIAQWQAAQNKQEADARAHINALEEKASASADAAAQSATAASGSAGTASSKATAAADSAKTATEKASAAANSATSAASSASSAASNASTAKAKASDASSSASAAASSAAAAKNAQTAAEAAASNAQRIVSVDATLKVAGAPADAKATGDALAGKAAASHTHGNMAAATASAAGKAGFVPAPAAGAQAKYLRGDGTWQTPPDTNTTYGAATQSAAGLMSAADKKKLDNVAAGANAYSLPTATASVLGGVKTGSNITNSGGTISITKANVTAALGYTPPTDDALAGKADTNHTHAYLPLSGGTVSGPINFANGTWNTVGDDAYMGDHNVGGGFCIMGINDTTKLVLVNKDNPDDYAVVQYSGGNLEFSKTLGASITGSAGYADSAGSAPANGGTATNAEYIACEGIGYARVRWAGQGGQPSWLFGSNDGVNWYVWNPSNFNVNYANGAGNVGGYTFAAQTTDPGAGSALESNKVLLVYQ